ncbi:MAG: trypsin-like peptidase domain-containing protein [Anaeromyxobacter sp.]
MVEGAEQVEVDRGEGQARLPARVVGLDSESDVALLKVDAGAPLPVLPLGDSEQLGVAEWVMVIGNPFGLDHSVTLGIVSHTGRADISPVGRPGTYDFVQTDASINPGNSGGPVLNLHGEVVAIATAVNATGQGIGFAIPINMAKEIVGQLKTRGKVIRSWLGVSVREPEPGPAATAAGVEVVEVADGSPAARAGVRVGDIITTVQGHAIHTPSRLRWYVSTAGVGQEIELRLRPRLGARAAPGAVARRTSAPSPASTGAGAGGVTAVGAAGAAEEAAAAGERTLRAVLVEVPSAEQAREATRPLVGE